MCYAFFRINWLWTTLFHQHILQYFTFYCACVRVSTSSLLSLENRRHSKDGDEKKKKSGLRKKNELTDYIIANWLLDLYSMHFDLPHARKYTLARLQTDESTYDSNKAIAHNEYKNVINKWKIIICVCVYDYYPHEQYGKFDREKIKTIFRWYTLYFSHPH